MKRNILLLTTLIFMTLVITSIALANRFVVVNGQLLHPSDVYVLEQAFCGPIPDGVYQVDPNTGYWWHPGDFQPRGHVLDNCRNQGNRSSSNGQAWKDEGIISTHDLCPECGLALP